MNTSLLKGAALACVVPSLISLHAASSASDVKELEAYTVSAGPVPRLVSDYSKSVTTLTGDEISESAGTLGDLLDDQVGITSTSFGAGASRPIIRGFDGPRVRIMQAGLEAVDVSNSSPDHAVSFEPLLTDRIEIIRGPGTLLYGSSAIGGIVNVIDSSIPREDWGQEFVAGEFELRYDSVSEGETFLGKATVGDKNWAIRVTGLSRRAEDYDIPGEAELHSDEEHDHDEDHDDEEEHEEDEEHHDEDEEHHDEESVFGTLENSAVETDAFSVGGTWFFGDSRFIGASFSTYDSLYGVPGHSHAHGHEEEHDDEHEENEDHDEHEEGHDDEEGHDEDEHGEEEEIVNIDLERVRFDLELSVGDLPDFFEAVSARLGYTDYEHTELEGDEIGTVFATESFEARVEALHGEWMGADDGVVGLQWSIADFEAIGEEAFTPPSETQSFAVFAEERKTVGSFDCEFGARLEHQDIETDAASDYSDLAVSLALGAIYDIDDVRSVALSVQRAQRHPTSTELYADGAHLATSQYERGDASLDIETAYSMDIGYRVSSEQWKGGVTAYVTQFDEYIHAENTGLEEDELPLYQFEGVDALFWGFEAKLDRSFDLSAGVATVGVTADYVNAENTDNDESLPRIPPLRLGAKLKYVIENYSFALKVRHAFEQDEIAEYETETAAFTELDFSISYSVPVSENVTLGLFLRGDNLLDEEIRHHTSFIKDLAPQPGRNFQLGARLEF